MSSLEERIEAWGVFIQKHGWIERKRDGRTTLRLDEDKEAENRLLRKIYADIGAMNVPWQRAQRRTKWIKKRDPFTGKWVFQIRKK